MSIIRFPFWGPILSGFLIGTSYIPFPPWAIFFCCVPLWWFALNQKRLKSLIVGGFLCQFIVTIIGFNWVAYAIKAIDIPLWPQTIILCSLFLLLANLHIPLSLFFWFVSQKLLKRITSNQSLYTWLLLPLFFALCTQYYPMVFKWHFGYTWFYAKWPAAQTAEIWGFQFINTLILFSNLLFLFVFKNVISKEKLRFSFHRGAIALSVWLVCFIALQVWGGYLKNRLPQPDKKIRVLMVQPNIENEIQEDDEKRNLILSRVLEETEKHLQVPSDLTVDFILWPEGVYPYKIHLQNAKEGKDLIQLKISVFGIPLVVSAKGKRKTGYTNSLFVFDKQARLVQAPYDKILLVPFGEYTPGEKWFPFIDRFLFDNRRAFERGTEANKIITLNTWRLGFQICYEGLFDGVTRDTVKKGVDVLVNVSNDAWFGNWQEPWQHLYMTLSRAVEARRPLIRSTNSGFSAVVSAKGEITSPMVLGKSFSQIQEISFYSRSNKPSSLFTSWGYYINTVFLWAFLALICLQSVFKFLKEQMMKK